MKCDHCGADVKQGAKTCPECGMKMAPKKSRRDAIAGAMAKVKDTDHDNA
jgi:uncharacterized membrane protein YvbJ